MKPRARPIFALLFVVTLLADCSLAARSRLSAPLTRSGQSAAGLPRPSSVKAGRFIESVELDGGLLRVDPAPVGMVPSLPRGWAAREIWASPVFQGSRSGAVMGLGLVTTVAPTPDGPPLRAVPAWVGFAWGGAYACPAMMGSPAPVHLPSGGYAAVILSTDGGPPAITYTARTSVCGSPPFGPKIAAATKVVSIPWHQVGDASSDRLTLAYTLPGCGRLFLISGGGNLSSVTVTVEAVVPDLPRFCALTTPATTRFNPGGGSGAIVHHAPLGLVRQIQL